MNDDVKLIVANSRAFGYYVYELTEKKYRRATLDEALLAFKNERLVISKNKYIFFSEYRNG